MFTRSMTAQMAKNKNAKIEMLEAKIEMLETKIEMLETKIELFNTETNIETTIPAKKSKNIIANKTYISTYFIMIIFIMSIYILFNEKKDDVNELIKKYYAIVKDYYC